MISIIICSRKPQLDELLLKNINDTVGVEHEVVCIDNSDNQYSIFSAYNKGIALSKYPYICLVHDDVLFHTNGWGQLIIRHLAVPGVGLCGIAGGDVMSRVPSDWLAFNPSVHITHTDKSGLKPQEKMFLPVGYPHTSKSVVLLDGVFICARKDVFSLIRFDETFGGFHGYDYDISMQSIQAGFKNYVVYDVDIEHFSTGRLDATYFRALFNIWRKWIKVLPVFEQGIDLTSRGEILRKVEKTRIKKLFKRMIRAYMTENEVYDLIKEAMDWSGQSHYPSNLLIFKMKYWYVRINSELRNKMNN
jgi:Glycosyltransferase like family